MQKVGGTYIWSPDVGDRIGALVRDLIALTLWSHCLPSCHHVFGTHGTKFNIHLWLVIDAPYPTSLCSHHCYKKT